MRNNFVVCTYLKANEHMDFALGQNCHNLDEMKIKNKNWFAVFLKVLKYRNQFLPRVTKLSFESLWFKLQMGIY